MYYRFKNKQESVYLIIEIFSYLVFQFHKATNILRNMEIAEN
jgi:hypothetical protein